MAKFIRLWIDIQGSLHDLWSITDVEKGESYNHNRGEMEYSLLIMRKAMDKDLTQKIYKFHTEEERDGVLDKIKTKLKTSPNIAFLGEDDDADKMKGTEPDEFDEL